MTSEKQLDRVYTALYDSCMTSTSTTVSAAVRNDFQATSSERWGGDRKRARLVRADEHRQGLDHGKGCTHCDEVNGR